MLRAKPRPGPTATQGKLPRVLSACVWHVPGTFRAEFPVRPSPSPAHHLLLMGNSIALPFASPWALSLRSFQMERESTLPSLLPAGTQTNRRRCSPGTCW